MHRYCIIEGNIFFTVKYWW